MNIRRFIVPFLCVLSIYLMGLPPANAAKTQTHCIGLRPHTSVPQGFGLIMRRLERTQIDIQDQPVHLNVRMANLRGPSVTLIGRDIRLSLDRAQTSPQELWHKANWHRQNKANPPCADPHRKAGFLGINTVLRHSTYTHMALENNISLLSDEPFVIYRTRLNTDLTIIRPYGLILGASAAIPISSNTYNLLLPHNPHAPIRRDTSLFDNTPALTRLYASYQATPVQDTHLSVTGGYLEDMYAGFGAELIYRPYPSLFWFGADIWSVWRRDYQTRFNMGLTNTHTITGHLRAGYDFTNAQTSLYAATGRYLNTDFGATLGLNHQFENGAKLDMRLTWSDTSENYAMLDYTKLEPALYLTWPLNTSSSRHTRAINTHFHQLGRDNGQMLSRPRPLEYITTPFSAPRIAHAWPQIIQKNAAQNGGLY